MLWLERCALDALTVGPDGSALPARAAARTFVAGSLRAMPRHLRLGTAVLSVTLGAGVRLRHGPQPGPETVRHHLEAWLRSPVGPLRQYARLLTSLTLFAVEEAAAAGTGGDTPATATVGSGTPTG
jgi:hypothetical protein